MEKVLVVSDLEGISTISSLSDSTNYIQYAEEINIVSNKVRNQGYEVYICDVHNGGTLLKEQTILATKIYYGLQNIDFKIDYDYAILLGFHGRAGDSGIWVHSFKEEIKNVYLERDVVGEVGVICTWLNNKGIQVVQIIGAEGIEEEAKFLNVTYSVVKKQNGIANPIDEVIDSIVFTKKKLMSKCEKKVQVEFVNPDIAYYLVDRGFKINNKREIVFDNLEIFIKQMDYFCTCINNAILDIYQRNMAYIKKNRLKLQKYSENMIYKNEILQKPVEYVTWNELIGLGK